MRLALPKGRLLAGVCDALAAVGVTFTFRSERDYHPACSEAAVEGTLYKPRSIPRLIDLGFCDAGFTGLDVLRDAMVDDVVPLVDLGLARVRLVVALPGDRAELLERPPARPIVIATEYPRLASAWAMGRGLSHIVVESHGSTEAYVRHVADVVVDCVETGSTLEANGLVAVETLFESATCFVARRQRAADPLVRTWARALVERGGKGLS